MQSQKPSLSTTTPPSTPIAPDSQISTRTTPCSLSKVKRHRERRILSPSSLASPSSSAFIPSRPSIVSPLDLAEGCWCSSVDRFSLPVNNTDLSSVRCFT